MYAVHVSRRVDAQVVKRIDETILGEMVIMSKDSMIKKARFDLHNSMC